MTAEASRLHNVVLVNAGLGERDNRMLLETTDDKGRALGGGSRIVEHFGSAKVVAEEVDIRTIDNVLPGNRVDPIIQFDVEGWEKAALGGALTTIQRCPSTIILEVLLGSTLLDSAWFSANIITLGYREIGVRRGNTVFSCDPDRTKTGCDDCYGVDRDREEVHSDVRQV